MIRIALCDDSELQLEVTESVLNNYIQTRNEEMTVELYRSGEELIRTVREKGGYDVYILDMIMPGMNGMEVASLLRIMNDTGKIVFLTSTMEYAVQSYDVEASAYLLKPVDTDKLRRSLDKILNALDRKEQSLIIQTVTESMKLDPLRINYVTLENRKLKYVLTNGRVLMGKTIRTRFQEEIAPLLRYSMFSLCGISLLINLRQVEGISGDSVMMKNGEMLFPPVSAMNAFRQTWWNYKN